MIRRSCSVQEARRVSQQSMENRMQARSLTSFSFYFHLATSFYALARSTNETLENVNVILMKL